VKSKPIGFFDRFAIVAIVEISRGRIGTGSGSSSGFNTSSFDFLTMTMCSPSIARSAISPRRCFASLMETVVVGI